MDLVKNWPLATQNSKICSEKFGKIILKILNPERKIFVSNYESWQFLIPHFLSPFKRGKKLMDNLKGDHKLGGSSYSYIWKLYILCLSPPTVSFPPILSKKFEGGDIEEGSLSFSGSAELSLMGGLAGLGGWLQDTLQQSFRTDGDLKAGKRPKAK